MIASYWWRLAWLALACFFAIHLAVSAAVTLAAPRIARFAERFDPRTAARALFLLRLFPAIFAAFAMLAVCLPSYFWLEPTFAHERVGWIGVSAACLTVLLWLDSAIRFARITSRSSRYMRRWRREGHPAQLPGAATPALLIPSHVPFLALAGIAKPRLIASSGLLRTLSKAELAAAVRHEEAHRVSRDNLTRLIMNSAPRILPFVPASEMIEQAWAKFAERAADDRAVSSDPARAVRLAEALVRVARIGGGQAAPAAPLLADRSELHTRVNRLLCPLPAAASLPHRSLFAFCAIATLCAAALAPATLRLAHQVLEYFIH